MNTHYETTMRVLCTRFRVVLVMLVVIMLFGCAGVARPKETTTPTSTSPTRAVASSTLIATVAPTLTIPSSTSTPTLAWTATATPKTLPTRTHTVVVPAPSPIQTAVEVSKLLEPDVRKETGGNAFEFNTVIGVYVTDLITNKRIRIFGIPPGKALIFNGIASAAWSPRGDKILLSYSIDDFRKSTLQIINVDGSFNRDLTPQPGGIISHAIWSPDGSQVAFRFDSQGQACVYTMDLATETLHRFNLCEYQDEPRYWSVDGKWLIVYFTGQQYGPHAELDALGLDNQQRLPISHLSGTVYFDERYYPWRKTDKPSCPHPAGVAVGNWNDYWYCQ